MKKASVLALILLLGIAIAAPSIAFAQEFLPTPAMMPPVALVAFGFLSLVGGVAGYVWRRRGED